MSSVSVATAKSKVGTPYKQGCSGFVCELLGKPWKSADSFHTGAAIGSAPPYRGVQAGDIVGFAGHVAVYVGEADLMFIDVNGANGVVRIVKRGYGQEVYKKSY